jgi:hypothetical protein
MFLLSLVVLLVTVDADITSVPSRITSVRIHGNKAEVTRELKLNDYEDGNYIYIRVDNLPNQLEDKSVRIKGVGNAEIVESSVTSRALSRDLEPGFKRQLIFLQQLLTHVSGEIDASRAAVQRNKAQKDYVEIYTRISIDPYTQKSQQNTKDIQHQEDIHTGGAMLTLQAMTEMLAFQDSITADMDHKIAVVSKELSDGLLRLNALQSSIDMLRNKGIYTPYIVDDKLYCPESVNCQCPSLAIPAVWPASTSSKSVEVRILTDHSPGANIGASGTNSLSQTHKKPLKLSITYLASPARWYPEYDIRLEGEGGEGGGSISQYRLEVDYYAAVEQQTQEV